MSNISRHYKNNYINKIANTGTFVNPNLRIADRSIPVNFFPRGNFNNFYNRRNLMTASNINGRVNHNAVLAGRALDTDDNLYSRAYRYDYRDYAGVNGYSSLYPFGYYAYPYNVPPYTYPYNVPPYALTYYTGMPVFYW